MRTLTRNWRDHQRTGTHKHTKTVSRYFDRHGCLFQSEESKCPVLHPSLSQLPGGTFCNSLVTPSLSCVHKHLLSSDWERRPCLSKYLDTVSVCLCVPFLWWSLQFLVRVFTFLSLNLLISDNEVISFMALQQLTVT